MSFARENFCRKTPDDVVWEKTKIKLNKTQGNYFKKNKEKEKSWTGKEAEFGEEKY